MPGKQTPHLKSKKAVERADEAVDLSLVGEDAGKLLEKLTPYEQRLFWQAVAELRSGSDPQILHELWRIDYERQPPTIEEFIDDEYWLGSVTRPSEDSTGLFPTWKEVLLRDFDLDSRLHNIVLTGSLGGGKCLGPLTCVRMHDGSIKMAKDICYGDKLMGPDGGPRFVLDLVRGREPMFGVEPLRPVHGMTWECNASHIQVVKRQTGGGKRGVRRSVLEEIPTGVIHTHRQHGRMEDLRLIRTGFELPDRPVPIDPYILGVWLGDGTVSNTTFNLSREKQEVVDSVLAFAASHDLDGRVEPEENSQLALRVIIKGPEWRTNWLRSTLDALGLLGIAGHGKIKSIPDIYLRNSTRVRRELLAGIIDTDFCKHRNGCYETAFADESFCRQVQNLAWSLGYAAGVREKTIVNPTFKTGRATAWRITISGAYDLPIRIKRKQSSAKVATRSGGNRRSHDVTGFRLRPLGDGAYYGFTIDGDHRFLLADGTITHNSFNMMLMLLYRITLARLLRNPAAFYGLSKGSEIYFVILSIAKAVVEETVFGTIKNFMTYCPFFREVCHYDPERRYADLRIPLGKQIFITAGSKSWHIIGRNAMGVAMDEGNFRLEANPDMRAYNLFNDIRVRIKNRFQKSSGFLPAISLLASSAADESSVTERIVNEIETGPQDGTQKIYRFASYEVRPDVKDGLSGQRFKVAYGIKSLEPAVLNGIYGKDNKPLGEVEAAPSGAKIALIPIEYLAEFKRNVRVSLQSIAGVSTGGNFRLFGETLVLERAISLGEESGLINPCSLPIVSLSEEDHQQMWDFLDHKMFLTREASRVIPKRDPSAARFIHLDLAKRSQGGLAVGHIAGQTLVKNKVDPLGQLFSRYGIVVEYDFILAYTGGKAKPISIKKILAFIYWLRDICNYRIELVTADQYQSLLPLELLEQAKFKVANLSVDRLKKPYYDLRSAFEEERIRMYRHHIGLHELENLMDGAEKVDHPPEGCFSGDTRIALANGQCPTFEELSKMPEPFYVYSMTSAGLVIAAARNARITKRVQCMVQILLDNFQVICCTPEHLFMTLNHEWCRADNLTPDVSLMPLYRSVSSKGGWTGYEKLWCPVRKQRLLTHHIAFGSPIPKCHVIHHKDENKRNNCPWNLELLTRTQHPALHGHASWKTRQAVMRQGFIEYFSDPRNRNAQSIRAKALWNSGAFGPRRAKCAIEGCQTKSNAKGLCDRHYQQMRRSKIKAHRQSGQHNHRILEVILIDCDESVYDLTVPVHHNFALAAGVFVHNSKDVSDCICGVYTNAISEGNVGDAAGRGSNPSLYTPLDIQGDPQKELIPNLIDTKPYARKPREFRG
jgi:intein/homing endonuclease